MKRTKVLFVALSMAAALALGSCGTFSDPGARQACINDAAC